MVDNFFSSDSPQVNKLLSGGDSKPQQKNILIPQELPAALQGLQGELVSAVVKEQKSDSEYILLVEGEEVVVKTDLPLSEGDKLNLRVTADQGRVIFELLGKTGSGADTDLARLLELIGVGDSASNRRAVFEWLQSNPDADFSQLLNKFDVSNLTPAQMQEGRELFTLLKSSFISSHQENLATDQAQNFLADLDMQFSPRLVRLLDTIFELGYIPDRPLLEDMNKNLSLLQDDSGELNLKKIRNFVFLHENKLPVSKEVLNRFNLFGNEESASAVWEKNPELPRLFGSVEAGELRELIRSLGLDLERRLVSGDQKAADTARVLLENLGLDLSGVVEETEASKNAAGLLMRQVLASLADEHYIYLVVPFQDADETKFMRVRFRDDRKEKGESREKNWSVNLELSLSKLGRIRVKALKRDEKVKIEIGAEKKKSVFILEKNATALLEKLESLGYRVSVHMKRIKSTDKTGFIETDLMPPETTPGRLNIQA